MAENPQLGDVDLVESQIQMGVHDAGDGKLIETFKYADGNICGLMQAL